MFRRLKQKQAVETVNIPDLPTELRFSPRKDVFADTTLETTNGQKLKGIVLDVSHCGARLRFVVADCMTEMVQIEIPRLRVRKNARVRWKTRTDIGIEFLD